MAKTVVVSPQALEGIDAEPDRELILAKDSAQFVTAITSLLAKKSDHMGLRARQKIINRYGWENNLACIATLLDTSLSIKESS